MAHTENVGKCGCKLVRDGIGISVEDCPLHAAAPELLAALKRAVPWIGKLIADGGHMNAVAPNDAIGALDQAEAAIARAEGS